jgi:HSP20 family protein
MRTLVNINPADEFRAMENLFNQLWETAVRPSMGSVFPIDVMEQGGNLVIRASVPGIAPEKLEVSVENQVLTIRGEVAAPAQSEDAKVYLREIPYGSFSRSLRLPKNLNLDSVDAAFQNGIVTITIPKIEPERPEAKRITVRTESTAPAIESAAN